MKKTREKASQRERARKLLTQFFYKLNEVLPGVLPIGDFDSAEEEQEVLDLLQEDIDPEAIRFARSCIEILSSAATKSNPSIDALDAYTSALNRPVVRKSNEWEPLFRSMRPVKDHPIEMRPPWTVETDVMRQAAEILKEYLELIEFIGPLHGACRLEGCPNITFGGRGNKAFCSDAHRAEWWSYQNRPDYYKKKQVESQKRKNKKEKTHVRRKRTKS